MKKNRDKEQKIDRDDGMELQGTVLEALPGTLFSVMTTTGNKVLATLSGKLRQNHIVILPGDSVSVVVSPYDTSRGRITWRK